MKEKYKNYTWLKSFGKKFLLRTYINYTLQQELLSKSIRILYKKCTRKIQKTDTGLVIKRIQKIEQTVIKVRQYFNNQYKNDYFVRNNFLC